ncbi:hypothetical protein ACP70R_015078 [Stipagrostis hirtigluma subsp. patula]
MKTKAGSKVAVDEDEAKLNKIRSSRSKHRHGRRSRSRSSSGSESPPRKRSKKPSKRIADKKKSKRSKVTSSSSRRRRSRSRSLSSSSASSVSRSYSRRSCSTCSSASERSVSPPPRSRSRDVRKRKGRGRDRERDRKRKRARRSESYSSSTASSGRSRSRSRSKSKSRKRRDEGTRDKVRQDYDNRHAPRSVKNMIEDVDRNEEAVANAKKGEGDTDMYKKNEKFDKMESPSSKDANDTTEEILPASSRSPVAEDLELILRQKALENFRKFRQAAVMSGRTHNNSAGKEPLTDCQQNAGTKIAEARSAAAVPLQRQGSSPGVRHSSGSPLQEDCGNGTSHSGNQENSAGVDRGVGSPRRVLEAGDTGGPTQQKESMVEATHSTSQLRSPQDGRNSRSVMQRLVRTPGSSANVNQRLGSSTGVSHVNGSPRVRSVVSIPAREGLDAGTFATSPRPCENSALVESSSKVGRPLIDINDAEGTNEDDRRTIEGSASNGSILSPAEGTNEARIEDKDGSQFQKKTFSRMHDGETVEVSYKVYIPKKTPALARRKLQR